ncbi:hypothetical protein ACFP3U_18565 [Kitasatospora misakiensis]|uniref:Uncharacterized protein n=1 Tax=Kitasatospora misakiensis TaxID=67330 RepID=A0ABW0X346_9ACTN
MTPTPVRPTTPKDTEEPLHLRVDVLTSQPADTRAPVGALQDRGCSSVELIATPGGLPLYRNLGFNLTLRRPLAAARTARPGTAGGAA